VSTKFDNGARLLRDWIVLLAVLSTSSVLAVTQERPERKTCYSPDEYEQVLDAYFAHARRNGRSAVVLRVYGWLIPEYELVLDPSVSSHSIFWFRPRKSIWGSAYDGFFAGKHREMQDYVS
jgi:hypothetical protein